MKVQCPACSTQVPAGNVHLDTGWGKCEACHEIFALASVVPDFPPPIVSAKPPAERPFNARAVLEKTRRELTVTMPPQGLRGGTIGMLGFALFWNGFVTFWTCGALGLIGKGKPETFNFCFAAFSIPFWIVGFAMLGGIAWNIWGVKSIVINGVEMTTLSRCLLWRRSRRVPFDDVQLARHYESRVQKSGESAIGFEVIYRKGSFVIPTDSINEAEWLIGEVNEFIRNKAGVTESSSGKAAARRP